MFNLRHEQLMKQMQNILPNATNTDNTDNTDNTALLIALMYEVEVAAPVKWYPKLVDFLEPR